MFWKDDVIANGGSTTPFGLLRAFLFDPGAHLLACHRAAIGVRGVPGIGALLARLLWRHGVRTSGCHISLEASVGPGLKLPHPTGVVIGEGVTVGAGVTLYQNVTLGRTGDGGAYPTVEDGAILYSGVVAIGGIRIGARARVGANAVVLHDVPPGRTAVGAPARVVDIERSSR